VLPLLIGAGVLLSLALIVMRSGLPR